MMIIDFIVIIAIAFISFGLLYKRKKQHVNLPGPKALPLVGNLHQLNKARLHVQLLQWAKQYGPIYRLWFGHKPVVVVTGSKQIHDVLVVKGKDFNGRSKSYIINEMARGDKDFAFSDVTPECKIQKKLFTTTLKGYGSGLQRIEEITTRYMNDWIDDIMNTCGEDGIDIWEHLVALTYNIINTIALRESLHTTEHVAMVKEMMALRLDILHRTVKLEGFLLDTFPWLRFVAPAVTNAIANLHKLHDTFFMNLKMKELDLMNTDEMDIRDMWKQILLSHLIKYQMTNNQVTLDDEMLADTLMEAYAAGILTTTTTLSYLFYILAKHESLQSNIQKEIDSIIKNTNRIHLKDKERMPYAHATLLETLRFTSIVPILLPHRSTKDTDIDGHRIPQDTEVWINAWGLHHDDAVWDQPFKFMPERFLDSDGTVVAADHPNRKNLVAFGTGQRVCAGETFAMSRMFLILTMFLQKFSVRPFSTDGHQPTYDSRDIDLGILLEPPQYQLKLQARV